MSAAQTYVLACDDCIDQRFVAVVASPRTIVRVRERAAAAGWSSEFVEPPAGEAGFGRTHDRCPTCTAARARAA